VESLFSAETYNISETGQDRTKVTMDNQLEVTYALSIGAKITTLDVLEGLKGHYALCFKTHVSFEDHHGNVNEGRPILSATTM